MRTAIFAGILARTGARIGLPAKRSQEALMPRPSKKYPTGKPGEKKTSLLEALTPSNKAKLNTDFDFPKLNLKLKPADLD